MQIILGIVLVCLLGISWAASVKSEGDNRAIIDDNCGVLLAASNIYCVSKTQFVPGFQDPATATPLDCPAGKFCVLGPTFCSSTGTPVCSNEVPGANGACGTCAKSDVNVVVCTSRKEFGFCTNGVVKTGLTYSCPSATPYCKADYDFSDPTNPVLMEICTVNPAETDCAS